MIINSMLSQTLKIILSIYIKENKLWNKNSVFFVLNLLR